MKRTMKKFGAMALAAALLAGVVSCEIEGPDQEDIVRFEATINNANTIPRAISSAQGTANLEYKKSSKTLSYNITYQGLTPTVAHIHAAQPAWENGPVIFPLSNVTTSPITGSVTLNQEQEDLLRLGNMYINIHTEQYPTGEIRGQILPTPFGEDE